MANVLIGATGSVAAVKVPELIAGLRSSGHSVRLVVTDSALYFFDPAPYRDILTSDSDEWPGDRYARGDVVRHIELRNWAECFLVAPLDANTLAKFAAGICDNALTCVWRAWDTTRPIILAPAMNTAMWRHPQTRKHLRSVAEDWGGGTVPREWNEDRVADGINQHCPLLRLARPIEKALACGDTGVGAMAEPSDLVALVQALVRR